MSFQAYIDNIKQRTGKSPDDFKALAATEGLLQPGVKTGQIVARLKKESELDDELLFWLRRAYLEQ